MLETDVSSCTLIFVAQYNFISVCQSKEGSTGTRKGPEYARSKANTILNLPLNRLAF